MSIDRIGAGWRNAAGSSSGLLSKRISTAFVAPFIVVLALLIPLSFGSPESTSPFRLGLPRVFSGDEPHYLVMLNSILLDGDLDLTNNYASVHQGSEQAGQRLAGSLLDHHTVWFKNDQRKDWPRIFQDWSTDAAGRPVPQLSELPTAEYSTHPPGQALLLAPFLIAFRNTAYVEPAAIACSTIAVIMAFFYFRALLRKYTSDSLAIDAISIIAFLGSPVWNYARTFYSEPYMLLFAVGAYSLALRNKSFLLAGTFIGLGILMKPPFLLIAAPVLLMLAIGTHFRKAVLFSTPIVLAIAITLALNYYMFGSIFAAAQEWRPGAFTRGALLMLASSKYGYFVIAPALIVALACWPAFFRTFPKDAIVLAAPILIYYILFSSYAAWNGASAYGARYLVPLAPLVIVPLVSFRETIGWRFRPARYVAAAICMTSIACNGIAAMPYWSYWNDSPLRTLSQFVVGP